MEENPDSGACNPLENTVEIKNNLYHSRVTGVSRNNVRGPPGDQSLLQLYYSYYTITTYIYIISSSSSSITTITVITIGGLRSWRPETLDQASRASLASEELPPSEEFSKK